VIIEAENREAAERVAERATRLGVPWTSGTHADGAWIEFLDPDGIALVASTEVVCEFGVDVRGVVT
jgi:hypothetical protein